MRMTLKRLTAWMLTLMMIVSCVPASAVEGSVVDYSAATSAYDVMPLDDETSTNDITVTFVIDNPDYTNDPGSNTTHVTAKAEIAGGDLTYTSWASRYKVTGTGTVCSYTIPAGTSLADNGYALPALSVENIGSTNTYTYMSSYSWIDTANMLCSVDTVFTEDTTLSMQLYVSGAGDEYSVDFICGEHTHSIKTSHIFMLGQSLSQSHIDAATEAANAFTSDWCTRGPASGEQLQKWQLMITETSEMVDLYAGMPITEAYVNEQYGNSIKAYAVWEEDTSVPVTATFQYTKADGTQSTTTRELNAGDALGELPVPEIPEGSTFIGWQYTAADNSLQYATPETVITEDTTYTAVFGTPVTATFKYVTYDEETGTEVEQIIEARQLNVGDALGTLPDMTAYETPLWVLAGWFNEEDADSEEIEYVTPDTVITENVTYVAEFSFPECGYVTLYDILPDGSIREDAMPNISLPIGMTIAEGIAANEEYDGFTLTDDMLASACIWRTAEGELADLTAVVTAETDISLYTYTYQIVLTLNLNTAAEAGIMTLSLVKTDTAADGTITMTVTAREGEKLTAKDFEVDGVDLTDYEWTDEAGNAVDLQSLIDNGVTKSITATSDGTLAAVEYTLTLNLTLDGVTNDYTITKAEGEVFTADDFVINGVDLTVFTWTEGDATVELTSLVGVSLTADRTMTSDGSLDTSLTAVSNKVNFYVYLDNEPFKVATKTVTSYKTSSADRRYISAATLAAVYGEYGFSASQLQAGTKYFPHTDENSATVWADASVLESDGLYYSPIVGGSGNVDVYYLPEQSVDYNAGYKDSAVIEANGFYSIKVVDPAGLIYTKDTLPQQTVTFNGGNTSVTVQPAPEDAVWECVGQETGNTITPVTNSDGTLTFTVNDIQEPYIISLCVMDKVTVAYDVNLPYIPADEEYGRPTINGEDEYGLVLDAASAEEYILLAPSMNSYFYKSGKYLGEATFLGWALNDDTTNLVQPGAALDLSAYTGQTVTLTAQWEEDLGGTASIWNSSMINFFVALNAVSEGTTAWQGNTATSYFTQSVYTSDCGVTGTEAVYQVLYTTTETAGGATQYHILGGTSGTDLSENHDTIVRELSSGYTKTGADDAEYTFTASFPSDETVLRNVRRMVENGETTIKINERVIPASELTTTNFSIKWYVFKFDTSDGWHIDGILMAKSGEMIVTKTFAGDEAAISAIKTDFTIDVSGGVVNTGGELRVDNATTTSGNTYTWKVPVDQYYDYTITENNYKYDVDLATYKSQYRVRHSNNSTQNIGWTNYNDSTDITVTGRGYNETDDERLQVDFLNTYTAPGTVIVQKIDAVTGNLMPNVSFKIGGTRANDQSTLQMYHVQDSHYSADPNSNGTLVDTIITDASGQAYLWIGGGNYWLEEIVPDGYDDPGRISIILEGDSANSYKVVEISSASSANETDEKNFVTIGGDDELTLIVKNHSRTIDLKVEKIWANNENKPVTIQLYRDGKAMGADYTVNLDGSENWTHLFEDLPLYADGGLAKYTIREESIGDFMYSEEYAGTGGYQYYDVDYSGMQYLDASGAVTTDMTQVETIALDVTNARNNGSLAIAKVDENGVGLGGAEFYLYRASDTDTGSSSPTVSQDGDGHNVLSGLELVKAVTSSASGAVSFGNVDAGRYYLVEHSAPNGYTGSNLVYSLQFDGRSATMQYYADGAWVTTPLRVTNTSQTTDIPVTKQWVDESNAFGRRPSSITVTLTGTADGKVVSTQTVKITDENSDTDLGSGGTAVVSNEWSYTFEDLPLYASGSAISYTVTENAVPGYETAYSTDEDGNPVITNTLLNNLTYMVNKLVEGNFADPSKQFSFTAVVKSSAGETIRTESFTLAHGGSHTITDLPYGATVTVTEEPDGYTAQYMLGTTRYDGASYTSGAILDNAQGVTFINTKNVSIDTGVALDTLPYLLTFFGAFGAGALWLLLSRRRRTQA